MKRLLLAAGTLLCVSASAQTINVNQIRPSQSNGQVITTLGGITQWEDPIAGALFPANPGIVFNTSTIASRNATVSDFVKLIGTPSISQVLTATSATSASWQDLPPAMPTDWNIAARYQFLEGSGTVYHDSSGANFCSGAPCDITVVSGVPAGTPAPSWIPGANGKGAGIAMGSSPNNNYGLPTLTGTSCETVPLLQNQAHTIAFQFYDPPALEAYTVAFLQPYLFGTSGSSTGLQFGFYGNAFPNYSNRAGGNSILTSDNVIGLHDIVISYPSSGSPSIYIDGILSTNASALSNYALTATNFVLGCSNGSNAASSELYLFDLTLAQNAATALDAQQYHAAVSYTLGTAKSYTVAVNPIQSPAPTNQFLAVGDSTTTGIPGTGSTISPYAFCLKSGTVNCYSGGYTTALANVNQQAWQVNWYGQNGGGSFWLPPEAEQRDNKVFGSNSGIHAAVNWSGINGLNASQASSCAWSETVESRGWDAWVMTLYSLGTTTNDQTIRDPYNFTIVTSANACRYHVINLAEDGNMGKDGQNGASPWFAPSVGTPHAAPIGYAYVAQLVARVMNNFYGANMNAFTTYSAATVTMNGPDRNVFWNTSGNAIAATLPDCIGMGGSGIPYKMKVRGANSVTLTPAVVTGQTETINGTTSLVIPAGVYNFQVQTLMTSGANTGGCDWEQVP